MQSKTPLGAILGAVLTCALLAACGGGGGGGDPGNKPAAAPTPPQSTLTGTIAPIASTATVTVQLVDSTQAGETARLTATPDANGAFTILAPTSAIPKNSQVAAIVSAPGYLPTTVIYATDAAGALTQKSVTNALGTQGGSGTIMLTPLLSGTFSFGGLDVLHRLGDGTASGLANSLLQLPPPSRTSPLTMKASERTSYLDPSMSQLQVSVLVRGLEESGCPGAKVTLRSFNAANAELAAQALPMVDSPSNGEFGIQTFAFPLDSAGLAGGSIQLEIRTGECWGDVEDMEFVGATGKLN
jgi:hypothetical protein